MLIIGLMFWSTLEVTYTDRFLFDCDDLVEENLAIDQIYNIPGGETEPCD